MAPKPILFSGHAVEQMRARGLGRRDVKFLLAKGEREDRGHGYWARHGYVARRQAAVVYHESATRILVISVWWRLTEAGQEREEARRGRKPPRGY